MKKKAVNYVYKYTFTNFKIFRYYFLYLKKHSL